MNYSNKYLSPAISHIVFKLYFYNQKELKLINLPPMDAYQSFLFLAFEANTPQPPEPIKKPNP